MITRGKKMISHQEKYCYNGFSCGWGLMFSWRKNLVMVFPEERRVQLHNWFVFYPIDVLVLDASKKIVEIKRNFKPFTFWNSKKKGKYVVELGLHNYVAGDLSPPLSKDLKSSVSHPDKRGYKGYKVGDKLEFRG